MDEFINKILLMMSQMTEEQQQEFIEIVKRSLQGS